VLLPPSPWIDNALPLPPKLAVDAGENSAHIRWQTNGGKPASWWLLQFQVNNVWTSNVLPPGRLDFYVDKIKPDMVVMRAVDRLGNVSEAAVWRLKKYTTPEV